MYDFELVRPQLEELCRGWGVLRLTAFGSSIRDDFTPSSDIDLIFAVEEDQRFNLFHHVRLQEELQRIFGRPVDLLTERTVTNMRNPFRKKEILSNQRRIYGS